MQKLQIGLIVIVSTLYINLAEAQNYYVKALGGYGFRIPGETYLSDPDRKYSFYSLGKGIHFGAGAGYQFNKTIGAELYFNHIISNDHIVSFRWDENSYYKRPTNSNMWQLMPAFTLSNKLSEKCSFVSGFGPIIGIGRKFIQHEEFYLDNKKIWEEEMRFTGSTPFGAFAYLEFNYDFSNKLYAIAQFRISALSYTPLKGEIIKYERNGVDKLDSLPINIRYREYSENYHVETSNPNVPSRYPFTSYNYSNISLQIGVGYRFIKTEENGQSSNVKKKKKKKRR